MSAPRHLLRWKGRQSGPFAPDEIRARLKSSDIGLMHEVQVDGQWMTVEKFLAASSPRPPAPSAPKQEKKAPAPPPKVEEPKLPVPLSIPPPPPPVALPPLMPVGISETNAETVAGAPSGEALFYGGFWVRCVAATIDSAIVSAIVWAFAAIALMLSGAARSPLPIWLVLLVAVLDFVGSWLYFSLMESSEIRATLGKLAVGLIVTDLAGERMTFTHASGRYLGKMVSMLTLGAGFFMAAFTERKQALHDLMAGTHVLLRLPSSRIFEP